MFKKLVSLICILSVFVSMLPTVAFAVEVSDEPVLELAYYKEGYYDYDMAMPVENAEDFRVPDEQKLAIGEVYYLTVNVGNMKNLASIGFPIHFDKDVVEIISFADDSRVEDGVYTLDEIIDGSCGIQDNFDFYSVWTGGDISFVNDEFPYVSNSKGLISLMFANVSYTSVDGIHRLATIKFRAKAKGKVDFRAATKADGEGCYEKTEPDGFGFYATNPQTHKSEKIEITDITIPDKYVGGTPEIIGVSPEEASVINDNSAFAVFFDSSDADSVNVDVYYQDEAGVYQKLESTVSGRTSSGLTIQPDISAIPEGICMFKFTISDSIGVGNEYITYYEIDRTPPKPVENLQAYSGAKSIELVWDRASEVSVSKYYIYRADSEEGTYVKVGTVNGRGDRDYVSYIDPVGISGEFYYYVTAVDTLGRESEKSNIASASALESEEPEIISILPDGSEKVNKSLKIDVSAHVVGSYINKMTLEYSMDEDKNNRTWTLYETKSLSQSQNGKTSFYVDTAQNIFPEDGKAYFRVIAWSNDGKMSNGEPVRTYWIDNVPPAKVTNLVCKETIESQVVLGWTPVSDDDFKEYVIEILDGNGKYTECGRSYVPEFTVGNLECNTDYTFRVRAIDICENSGEASEPVEALTTGDTNAPVVTAINPSAKYVNANAQFDVTIKATDNFGVEAYKIQHSFDEKIWNDVTDFEIQGTPSKNKSFTYRFDAASYGVGTGSVQKVYIRPVVKDIYGNISSEDAGIYELYIIDNDAPDATTGLVAAGYDGHIVVDWDEAKEDDVTGYKVYRKTADGEYVCVDENRKFLDYVDYNVNPGETYTYKIIAFDHVGNESGFSKEVTATAEKDDEAPSFYYLSPKNESWIKPSSTVAVHAKDNNSLRYVGLKYRAENGSWIDLGTKDCSAKYYNAVFDIADDMTDAVYYFKGYACDASGNIAESEEYKYYYDSVAPVITNQIAEADSSGVLVSWNCSDTDIRNFKLEYKTKNGYYTDAANINIDEIRNQYSITLPLKEYKQTYIVKITAYDKAGNSHTVITNEVSQLYTGSDDEEEEEIIPAPQIVCKSLIKVGDEERFDGSKSTDKAGIKSYMWDFGDGTKAYTKVAIHTYNNPGTYTVSLTVTNVKGNSRTIKKVVEVVEREDAKAKAKIRVVDDRGNAISGADVLFDYSANSYTHYKTDSAGYVEIYAAPGMYSVVVYGGNEYLPQKKNVYVNKSDRSHVVL